MLNHNFALRRSVKLMVQWRQKLRNLYLATVSAKKDDPDYVALRGHIPKDLFRRFKMFCLEREVDNSQGLEELLKEYFAWKDSQNTKETA